MCFGASGMRAPALGGEMDFRTDTYQIRQQAPNLAIFWGPVVEALPGKLCMLFDGAIRFWHHF